MRGTFEYEQCEKNEFEIKFRVSIGTIWVDIQWSQTNRTPHAVSKLAVPGFYLSLFGTCGTTCIQSPSDP